MYRLHPKQYRFYNWWNANLEDLWLYRFCVARGIVGPLNFLSVFGEPLVAQLLFGKKVFFTGENLHSHWYRDRNYPKYQLYYDLSLGFDFREDKNYLRFPLWITYLVSPEDNLNDIQAKIDKINDVSFRSNLNRTKFACIIARHDETGVRSVLGDLLEQISPVSYPGAFRNNTDELYTTYKDDKKQYLRQFRYNACPENSETYGYVTEKLFEAFMSGCIPIYWGSQITPSYSDKQDLINEYDIINNEAFLRYNPENSTELLNQIQLLESDPVVYQQFISIPPFKPDAAQKIWACIQELENRLCNLSK